MQWLAYIIFPIGFFMGLAIGYIMRGRSRDNAAASEGAQGEAQAHIAHLQAQLHDAQTQIARQDEQGTAAQNQLHEMKTERDTLRHEVGNLRGFMAKAEARIEAFDEAQEQARIQFENLSNELLKKNSKEFEEQSKKTLETITVPLKKDISGFTDKLIEFSALNAKMTEETGNLTKALSSNVKAQGNWGEFVLETILENSGLEKGVQYTVQGEGMGLKSVDGGRQMPDVVINLPEDRHIVIDSKLSLKSFSDYQNAADDIARQEALKAFVRSTENHIKDLASKNYQSAYGLQSLDFVMMFMPIEAAYILLMSEKGDLLASSMDKGISIVAPSNLFPNLKTINYLWQLQKQNQNAEEIARLGGTIYDKVHGFLGDMQTIDSALKKAQDAHDDAVKKLATGKGSVTSQAEKLKALGAKTNKALPDLSD